MILLTISNALSKTVGCKGWLQHDKGGSRIIRLLSLVLLSGLGQTVVAQTPTPTPQAPAWKMLQSGDLTLHQVPLNATYSNASCPSASLLCLPFPSGSPYNGSGLSNWSTGTYQPGAQIGSSSYYSPAWIVYAYIDPTSRQQVYLDETGQPSYQHAPGIGFESKPFSGVTGLRTLLSFNGSAVSSAPANTRYQMIQSVFYHQNPYYQGGLEFGFERYPPIKDASGNVQTPEELDFYWTANNNCPTSFQESANNCYTQEALNGTLQGSQLYGIGGNTYSVSLPIPALQQDHSYYFQAYIECTVGSDACTAGTYTSSSARYAFRVEIIEPTTGDKIYSQSIIPTYSNNGSTASYSVACGVPGSCWPIADFYRGTLGSPGAAGSFAAGTDGYVSVVNQRDDVCQANNCASGYQYYTLSGGNDPASVWVQEAYVGSHSADATSAIQSITLVSPSPNGTGTAQAFTGAFTDPAGATDISFAGVMVGNDPNGSNSCYAVYYPETPPAPQGQDSTQAPERVVLLAKDDGAGFVDNAIVFPTNAMTATGNIFNSQCSVTGASLAIQGNTLNFSAQMNFYPNFSSVGNGYTKNIYLYADTGADQRSNVTLVGSWNLPQPGAVSLTGVYQSSNQYWILDLNGNGQYDGVNGVNPDAAFPYGAGTSDLPLVGDWNGSGTTKVGVYRPCGGPSPGTFILDSLGNRNINSSHTQFSANITCGSGDVPVVGDWTGDGKAKVGLFLPGAQGAWYLDSGGNGQFSSLGYLGQSGDQPVVGNWRQPNVKPQRTSIGIFRNGLWLLDTNGDNYYTPADMPYFFFGQAGDQPLVGRWTGSTQDKVAVFRPYNQPGQSNKQDGAGLFVIDLNGDGNFTWADRALFFNNIQPGDVAVIGNWPSQLAPGYVTGAAPTGATRVGVYRATGTGNGTFFLDVTGDGSFVGRSYILGEKPVVGHWQ